MRDGYVDNQFAARGPLFDNSVGLAHAVEREPPCVEAWHNLPAVHQSGSLAKNVAVAPAPFAGQQWQQCEDAGIGRCPERQRCKGMSTPNRDS